MWIVALMLACTAPEWGDLPAPPPDAEVTTYQIALLGRVVGSEQRIRHRDSLWVHRRLAFEVDGSPVTSERRALLRFDQAGALSRYQPLEGHALEAADGVLLDGGNPVGPSPVYALWHTDPAVLHALGQRNVTAIEPESRTFREAELTPGQWTTGRDTVHYDLANGGHWRSGILTLEPGSATFDRVDVVGLLRVATDPIAQPARVRRMVAVVNGEQRVIERPLPQEIPRALPVEAVPPDGDTVLRQEVAEVLAGTTRRRDAVTLLVRTVVERLDHQVVPGSPEALAALQSGKGDCNDAAALFVALATAAGIPARPITGVVYRDGVHGPGFYPHAWAEVDYDGRWVAVDPSLGQIEADATHLPLGEGLDDPAVLMRLAPLQIRVVEVN